MSNKEAIYDLLEEAESYREKLKPKPEVKSRLTPEEQEVNHEAMLNTINQLLKYNEEIENAKK